MATVANPQEAKAAPNPQEAIAAPNPQEAKLADNPQEVRSVLAQLANNPAPEPAPKLNGRLVKHPDRPEIYLIVNGFRRHVLDEATMHRLFVTNRKVNEEFLIDHIAMGGDIAKGAMLAKGDHSPQWYLVAGSRIKMWIPNETVIAQYQFRAVTTVQQILVDSIPDGPNVEPRAK